MCLKRKIKEIQNGKKKQNCEDFEILFSRRFHSLVGKTSYESQNEIARNKKVELPSVDDVNRFLEYVTLKSDEAYEKIGKNLR